ncbi:MAG: hypothetical protein HY741_21470 [Chloroflexi bacterium]|nr:hypothetical protein [Chloroflexota bacterium]
MQARKFWRELYLTVTVGIALILIVASALSLRDLVGLGVIAAGVFIAVLGVGMYDQWQDRELAKLPVKARNPRRRS